MDNFSLSSSRYIKNPLQSLKLCKGFRIVTACVSAEHAGYYLGILFVSAVTFVALYLASSSDYLVSILNPPCRPTGWILLFSMIEIEAAILVELLAFLCSLSRFSVIGVKLAVQMNVLGLFTAADKVGVLLHGMFF